jgi:hypothetical protein
MASLESLLETGLDCKVRILENDTFIISKCKSDIITETTEVKSDKYTESYKSDKSDKSKISKKKLHKLVNLWYSNILNMYNNPYSYTPKITGSKYDTITYELFFEFPDYPNPQSRISNSYGICINFLRVYKLYDPKLETVYYILKAEVQKNNIDRGNDSHILEIVEDPEFSNLKTSLTQLFNMFRNTRNCFNCLEYYDTLRSMCLNCSIHSLCNFKHIKCSCCLKETNRFYTLKCNHKFHYKCISNFKITYNLEKGAHFRECPLCKTIIDLYPCHST